MFFRKKNKTKPRDFDYLGPHIEFCLNHSRWRDPPWSPNSMSELTEIETRLDIELPKAFKEYCVVFGADNHHLFGTQCFLETLQEQVEPWEEEEVKEFSDFFHKFYTEYPIYKNLPIFEFSNHDGYVSYCFVLNGDDNPECFVVMELDEIEAMGSFTNYLMKELEAH